MPHARELPRELQELVNTFVEVGMKQYYAPEVTELARALHGKFSSLKMAMSWDKMHHTQRIAWCETAKFALARLQCMKPHVEGGK